MIAVVGLLSVLLVLFNNVQGQGRGSIRLYDGTSEGTSLSRGIVEIYYDDSSKWGTVCVKPGDSTYNTAISVCRQLGYSTGTSISNSEFGNPNDQAVISEVSCTGNELNLLSCNYQTTTFDCDSSNNLAVSCSGTSVDFAGKVKLVGQTISYTGSGVLEVYCNGEWGLICRDGFTQDDANTVCRQLGFTNGQSSSGNGSSNQPIWFDTPDCDSVTQCISNCNGCPSSSLSSCSVNEVVGVTCSYDSNENSGTYDYCFFADDSTIKGLVGIIVGVIIAFFVCVALIILIPVICCCCLGVGIGAAASRPKYTSF